MPSGTRCEWKKVVLLSILVIATQLVAGVIAQAQQPGSIPRIGYLNANFPTTNPVRIEAIRQGLRELGYVAGKNIITQWAVDRCENIAQFRLFPFSTPQST